MLAEGIDAITAPRPELRCRYESPFHRIAVHVAKLLGYLGIGEDIKVIKASLPNALWHVRGKNPGTDGTFTSPRDLIETERYLIRILFWFWRAAALLRRQT